MHALVLKKLGAALEWTEIPDRLPGPGEIRVQVAACGVCRTDLHVVDGELPDPMLPIIPGHEIVGRIDALGASRGCEWANGSPFPGSATPVASAPIATLAMKISAIVYYSQVTRATGGGVATAAVADARFAIPLGEVGGYVALAPLLCAGLIGWRSFAIAGEGRNPGLYGFGAAAISWRRLRNGGAIGVRLHAA
jgi:alcohol dehydrogenase, propanol-preferring